MARLVLAPSHMQDLLHQIDVATSEMLDLNRTHRCVRGDDRGAVHVLPFLIRSSGGVQPGLLIVGQRAPNRMLALGQVANVLCQGPPTAAGLQHARAQGVTFLDTGFLFALVSKRDAHHSRVVEVFRTLKDLRLVEHLVTTNHVIAETITLTRKVGHQEAARLGDQLYGEKLARIHWAIPDEERAAFDYFKRHTRIKPTAQSIA